MTELLAPAGNSEKLKTALRYGADAVYLAGYDYSLRSGSENFDRAELSKAVLYAHSLGRRVYVAVNAFLHDRDFEEFSDYIRFLESISVDAVIVSDMGTARFILHHTNLRLHVSTQASVINSAHALVWKKLGAERIVVGREISVEQALRIKELTGLEVEMFIHGAMCMSYSGHCTISNYTAGRDSNRGGCIQSCRHGYHNQENAEGSPEYLISSKDLMGISHIEKMFLAGIDSLKIEGRMKSLLYAASATHAYASCLSALRNRQTPDISSSEELLNRIPHRGYTGGSLSTDADYASVYRDHTAEGEESRMAGYVKGYTADGHIVFYAVSRMSAGDELIFIGDAPQPLFRLNSFRNVSGETSSVMLPNHLYLFKMPKIQDYTVAYTSNAVARHSVA